MNNTLRDPDKITMTHTGLLPGKKGKLIHVSFERKTERGRDFAELVLPSRNVANVIYIPPATFFDFSASNAFRKGGKSFRP